MAPLADPKPNGRRFSITSEATPLLLAPETVPEALEQNGHPPKQADYGSTATPAAEHAAEEEERPMPYGQILILCYASLGEPIAYFAIFPFINEMIYRVGDMDRTSVGFWTGLIESLFSLVQMMLMIFYGRAADRFGRKPVLVFSLAGVSLATALFGMSQTLWQMILFRCFAGCFAGNVVTIRTMVSENCTKKSQARAFSWYMFARNLGIFIGPVIGGSLACPEDLHEAPGAFCRAGFFQQYPYALATYIAGFVCFTGTLACAFGLKETLKRDENGEPGTKADPKLSTWEVLRSPGVGIVLYIYSHTMLMGLAYTAVSPVFMYTEVRKGGLSFSDLQIASFLTVAGGSQALWMLIGFPPLQKRLGTGNLLRICAVAWPIMMASYPLFNEMLRHGLRKLFLGTFYPTLIIASGVSMAFACVQLTLNDISPSSTVLGTLNALALTVTSGVRAVAPVAFTSLYAIGSKTGWADGHLIWIVLVALGVGLNVAVYYLPAQAEGRYDKPTVQEEEGSNGQTGGAR